MNSPVESLLKQLIQFEKNTSTAVFIQISHQIIDAIQRGYLTKGTALPGSRSLSQLLTIHRNTVVAVYDELRKSVFKDVKCALLHGGLNKKEKESEKSKRKRSTCTA